MQKAETFFSKTVMPVLFELTLYFSRGHFFRMSPIPIWRQRSAICNNDNRL